MSGEFERMFNEDFTYLKAFMRSVTHYPDERALTCTTRDRSWTYRELNEEANRLAHTILSEDVTGEDVVMCCLFNTAEFVFCWIGTQKAGVVFSPINFRLAPGEIALHIEDSLPKVFIYDSDLRDTVKEALAMSHHKPKRVVSVGEGEPLPGAVRYEDYVASGSTEDVEANPKGPFDEIVRLYTSGTTGLPKGVPLNNICNLMRSYDVLIHFPLGPKDKTMNMTPWFHAGGLHSGGPCPTLHAGGEIVGLKTFNPKVVLDCVERYGLTFLIGAPVSLELLSQVQAKQPRDLSTLRGIVSMGAPLYREACIRYQKLLTPNIFNGYGTTETFWNTFLRPYDLPDKAGTAGRPCTDDLVRVVKIREGLEHAEPDDLVARNGKEEGEVIIRSLKAPYMYYNRPEEDKKQYYKGWYYTKDVATWDEEGYITICGRRDDMIICEGENIHPSQIEAIINEHPKVADSVVVGVPDPVKGEVVAAFVKPDDPTLTPKELSQFLTKHPGLAKFKRPKYIKMVEELPLTATGKKKHFVARELAIQEFKK